MLSEAKPYPLYHWSPTSQLVYKIGRVYIMSVRKKHVLKTEVSEGGAIYKEKSIDIFSVVLVCLMIALVLIISGFIIVDFLIPLIQSGAFTHVER